jgi:hypothetical protein
MKRQLRRLRRFQLRVVAYGNGYYIDRVEALQTEFAKKPRAIQIDLIGIGEIPADFALLFRSVLMKRSPKTRIITNACSSLQGGSVLVWLLGDSRMIRDNARLYFRRANLSETDESETGASKNEEPSIWDTSSELDPEEGDYATVLQLIGEFLPINELAGRLIGVTELRQFGLVDNEKIDQFLATALGVSPHTHGREKIETTKSYIDGAPKLEQPIAVDTILDFTI